MEKKEIIMTYKTKRHEHPVGWVPSLGPSMEEEASEFMRQSEFEKARAAYWQQAQTMPEYQKRKKKR